MRQPAEPGPFTPPLVRAACPVRADQHDLQVGGGVQRGQLGYRGAGESGQPLPRPGEPQRTGLPQAHRHRHGGQVGPLGRAQPDHQRLRVRGVALPQPGARAERGQQHGGRIGPGALGGGGQRGEGRRRSRGAGLVVRPLVHRIALAAREPAGPGAYAAATGRPVLRQPAGPRGSGARPRTGPLVGVGRALVSMGGVRAVVLLGPAVRRSEAVVRGRGGGGRRRGHPQVALAVRRRLQRRCPRTGGEPERRLAEPEQRAGVQPDRTVADVRAVQGGAVGGAEVGDGDPAVRGDGHRAVQTGHVGVVEGHVGVGRAADPDLPAVQQVDPARVRPRDHVQLGRDGVVRCLVLARDLEREHRPVDQGRLTERAPLRVEPLPPGEQHHRAAAEGPVGPGDGRGQVRCHGGQRRPRGGGDQHVAGARGGLAAARREDGQPDLHRRQRSLLRAVSGRGDAL